MSQIEMTLHSTWADIFSGDKRQNWEAWKKACADAGEKEVADYWTDCAECSGCVHIDGDWCTFANLPCTVNPVLTVKANIIGMACCGSAYTPAQLELAFEEDICSSW